MAKIAEFFKKNIFLLLMIAAVFLIVTIVAFYFINLTISHLKITAEGRFQLQVNSIGAQIKEKYNGAATTLRSTQGFFAGSENVTRNEFYNFIKTADFFNAYPGFSAFVYIKRVLDSEKISFIEEVRSDTSVRKEGYPEFDIEPKEKKNEYWPIVYASPEDKVGFLIGSDQIADPVRAENIIRARDTGAISLSTVVLLRQGESGVIIAAPLYKNNIIPDTIEGRRGMFNGAVTISLMIGDFFKSIFSNYNLANQHANITIVGRGNMPIPLFISPAPNSFFTKIFGTIEIKQTIKVDNNGVDFIFKVPAESQLTFEELYEPMILIFVFFAAILFISAIILILQKTKQFKDLKNRYTFISTLSHQLRTPLTTLRWYIDLIGIQEINEIKNVLAKGTLLLNSILNRMLLYISITEKDIVITKKRIDVEDLYTETLKKISEKPDLSQIKRIGNININEKINVDEEKVALALAYIVENALTYSPKEKNVDIKLEIKDQALEITINDYGYGIPEKEQKNMFSEFFRATNASLGENYGSGVSLFIAKKIIDAHNGTIKFTSKENSGSVFVIRIPLV